MCVDVGGGWCGTTPSLSLHPSHPRRKKKKLKKTESSSFSPSISISLSLSRHRPLSFSLPPPSSLLKKTAWTGEGSKGEKRRGGGVSKYSPAGFFPPSSSYSSSSADPRVVRKEEGQRGTLKRENKKGEAKKESAGRGGGKGGGEKRLVCVGGGLGVAKRVWLAEDEGLAGENRKKCNLDAPSRTGRVPEVAKGSEWRGVCGEARAGKWGGGGQGDERS